VFLAHRTRQRLRVVLASCTTYALVVAVVAVLFPCEGKSFASSFGWWLVAIPAGLAVYAALELFGTFGLGLPFWPRMPSWARVLLLVLLISLGAVGAVLLSQYFEGRRAA
jgi:hypothetical protein